MTEIDFNTESLETLDQVSEYKMKDYEKYRLKNEKYTIDISITDMAERDKENYIKTRKKDVSESQSDVPHPYKPEKQKGKKKETMIEFLKDGLRGVGYADPEYNLVSNDKENLTRYKYYISWKYFENQNKLVELEIYVPKDKFELDRLEKIRDNLDIVETG